MHAASTEFNALADSIVFDQPLKQRETRTLFFVSDKSIKYPNKGGLEAIEATLMTASLVSAVATSIFLLVVAFG